MRSSVSYPKAKKAKKNCNCHRSVTLPRRQTFHESQLAKFDLKFPKDDMRLGEIC